MADREPEADTWVATVPRSTRPVGGGGGVLPHPVAAPIALASPSASKTRALERQAADGVDELMKILVTVRSPCVSEASHCATPQASGSYGVPRVSGFGPVDGSLEPEGFDGS